MGINPVKLFVKDNIIRFEKDLNVRPAQLFNLYDKNNLYRGEYFSKRLRGSEYLGLQSAISVTRIMDDNLNQTMQEIVYMKKYYVTLKDPTKDVLSKVLPFEITTITTVLDFIKDRFQTVMRTSKLKNSLQRISENDPDFVYSDRFIIYEALKEKPQYEQSVEIIREGTISETKTNNLSKGHIFPTYRGRKGCSHQIPFRFW